MDFLASLFVGKPLNIVAAAGIFLAGAPPSVSGTLGGRRKRRPILVAAAPWALFAVWEWLVRVRTPEADIRVDFFLIWSGLAILSCWASIRLLNGGHS